jgi:putative ABC transport system permease protein
VGSWQNHEEITHHKWISMIKNYFKIALRNFAKRKFYPAINILGLSLGIGCSIFLYLFISYHLSFDQYHKNASRTYRVLNELHFEKTLHEKGASIAMFRALEAGVTHVSNAAVILSNYTFTVTVNDSSKTERRFKEDKNVALVSPSWFKMFDYKWIAGNADKINLPNTAVITQKQSVKYFGNANPIGKVIVFENSQPIQIVGLLSDRPFNTDLKSDIYVSLSSLKSLHPDSFDNFCTDWGWMNSTTSLYLTLNDKKSQPEVEYTIAKMAKANLGDNAKYYHFWLQPLADVHFNADYGGAIQKSLLLTLMIIGILVLLIASFNYINISIAQQSKRMVEIGTRKVLGGTTWQLFMQFIVETFSMVSIAMIIAIALVVLILPLANQSLFSQEPVHLLSYTSISVFISLLLIVLVMLSGFYPAVILSRINVFKAIKNEAATWKAGMVRKVLVVVQNSVACVLIICAFIMVLQVRFLKNTDIGFNRNAVVLVPLPDSSQLRRGLLRERLEKMPQVASFSFCLRAPSSENNFGGSVKFDNRPDWEPWPAGSPIGDTSYVKSFGLRIIAGRNIRESKASPEYLVNETMIHKLGLSSPQEAIGKSIIAGQFDDQKGIIAGVVKDFNTKSLEVPIEPVIIASIPERFSMVGIKLNGSSLQSAIQKIREDWEEVYPKEVFEYHFLDEQIAGLYQKENLQEQLIWLAASAAIIISCLGLLGLVSLITLQRTKEIGIRKVIGASVSNIVFMVSKDFLKMIFISILIASPVAWWAIHKWINDFAYRIHIEWWVFAVTGLFSVLIALATISFQAIKAAVANPVESLRTE